MFDFESLIQEVLNQKPELTRSELNRLVEQKKIMVGGGYLTDQGALFLVAGDLGIQLQRSDSSDLTLKDLYIGASDITVVGRVLALYPISRYAKKDGGEGRYRRLSLFDKNGIAKLTIWEDVDIVEKLGLKVDLPVRVVSAYVKQNLDGKPTLNLGKRGRIEVLKEQTAVSKIPSISELAKDVGAINGTDVVAAYGSVKSESKISNFSRNDGSQATMTHFILASEEMGKQRRVVIWSAVDVTLRVGQKVRVTNLRQKQQAYGDPELHGDSGSMIAILSAESLGTPVLVVSYTKTQESIEMMVVDANKILSRLSLRNGAAERAKDMVEGDVIEVSGGQKHEDVLVCMNEDCVKSAPDKSPLLPSMRSLFVKVKDVESNPGPLIMEVIALSKNTIQDVRLKDGSVTKKGELLVGDDTGEIGIAAWRESAALVEGVKEGERLRIIGVTVQKSKMNTPILQINQWSRVIKVNALSAALGDNLRL